MVLVFSFELKYKVLGNWEFWLAEGWLIKSWLLSHYCGSCIFMDRIWEGDAGHQMALVLSTFIMREGNRCRFPHNGHHSETIKTSWLLGDSGWIISYQKWEQLLQKEKNISYITFCLSASENVFFLEVNQKEATAPAIWKLSIVLKSLTNSHFLVTWPQKMWVQS